MGIQKTPEYVADTVGDGLGYDILSYDENGDPVYIEVKTTTGSSVDGFFMSNREVQESVIRGCRYRIYRVYNLNESRKTADIKIYEGPVKEESFIIRPTEYKIFSK